MQKIEVIKNCLQKSAKNWKLPCEILASLAKD
jgi:hypothetical protein